MKRYINSAKELSNGVFWVIDDRLYAFPFGSVNTYDGIAKSGNSYNHKRLWPDIKPPKCNKPYNYYPRGRVVVDARGQAKIFLNPNINDKYTISDIRSQFGIVSEPIILEDNSDHYKCYLDEGWKADN